MLLGRGQYWRRALTAALSHGTPLHFARATNSNATLRYSTAAAAATAMDPIERHFIEHDLQHPLKPPEDEKAEAAAQSIWKDAVKKDGGCKIVEAATAWVEGGKNKMDRDVVNALLVKLLARGHKFPSYALISWAMKDCDSYERTDMDKLMVLRLCAIQGKDEKAQAIFKRISEKTSEVYHCVLQALTTRSRKKEALQMLGEMKKLKMITTAEPYNFMLEMFVHLGEPGSLKKMLQGMKISKIPLNITSYRLLDEAREIFQMKGLDDKITKFLDELGSPKLKGRDWKDGIQLNASMGRKDEVLRLWNDMKSGDGFVPDDYCLIAAAALGKVGDVKMFEELCAEVSSRNGGTIGEIQTWTMVKVYTEKGMMEEAEAVFKKAAEAVLQRGLRSYHCMVAGYLKQGNLTKAVDKFNEFMEKRPGGSHDLPSVTVLLGLKMFAEAKDVKSAEELMAKLRCVKKRTMRRPIFKSLLKVYLAANEPVYGFEQRMEVGKVKPDKETVELLDKLKALA